MRRLRTTDQRRAYSAASCGDIGRRLTPETPETTVFERPMRRASPAGFPRKSSRSGQFHEHHQPVAFACGALSSYQLIRFRSGDLSGDSRPRNPRSHEFPASRRLCNPGILKRATMPIANRSRPTDPARSLHRRGRPTISCLTNPGGYRCIPRAVSRDARWGKTFESLAQPSHYRPFPLLEHLGT